MITYLKRRFSSSDLQGEAADKREQEGLPSFLRFGSTTGPTATATTGTGQVPRPPSQQQPNQTFQTSALQQQYPYRVQDQSSTGMQQVYDTQTSGTAVSGTAVSGTAAPVGDGPSQPSQRGRGTYPSAPSSPTRTYGSTGAGMGSGVGSFMGPMGSITGHISSTIMRGFSTAASTAQSMATGKSARERQKVLLVIDDSQTDWSKYFKGRKVLGDWDVRVEQAQYSEITMTAYSEQGCVINIYHNLSQNKPTRSFRPDFVLLRQHASGSNEDWQAILTGLMFGGTPCLNTLHAVYNMKNRPWLFAHLLLLRNRLGKETFPLINQVYHTSHKEMITAPAFPTIVKVGLGHGGEGKVRADNPMVYQDVTSMLTLGNLYVTTEPFIDAKCDLHIQKIGPNYKAFARKSISGNWKSNTGSSILEKVAMTERFKQWIDEISRMFGGLDICSVEVLQSKAGEYFIYDANGSDMCLFGDSQEDDRREIAELVLQRMQTACQQSTLTKTSSLQTMGRGLESERAASTTTQSPISTAPPNTQSPAIRQPLMSQASTTTHALTQPPQQQQPHVMSQTMHQVSTMQQQHPVLQQVAFQHQPAFRQQSAFQPQPAFQQQASFQQQPLSQTPPQQQQPQQVQTNQQPFRPPHSDSSQSPLLPKFGNQSTTTGASFSAQPDQGSLSSFSSTSSVFSGISSKIDGHLPSGQSTPVAQRDEGPTAYSISAPLSNQVGGAVQRNRSSSAQSQPFTPTQTSSYVTGSPWTGSSQSNENLVTTSGGNYGAPKNASVTVYESTDTFGRKFTGPGPASATSPPIISHQEQMPPCGSMTDNESTVGPSRPSVPPRQTSLRGGSGVEDSDDTMKNLRKTFAGIFGDM